MNRNELIIIFPIEMADKYLELCSVIVSGAGISDDESTFLESMIDSIEAIKNVININEQFYKRIENVK